MDDREDKARAAFIKTFREVAAPVLNKKVTPEDLKVLGERSEIPNITWKVFKKERKRDKKEN